MEMYTMWKESTMKTIGFEKRDPNLQRYLLLTYLWM